MSIFADDAQVFLDTNLDGESIVILPDGATPRTVVACVHRTPPQSGADARDSLERGVQIRLANNAVTGITLSELVFGKTKVELSPDRDGGTVENLFVHMPNDGQPWHDSGMIRLVVK